jgi:GAF domain-containing protein/two-component sensor histidine kinase
MFQPKHLTRPDPFAWQYRWLLRLGLRFYYPVAVVSLVTIIALVIRETFENDPFRRRLVIGLMLATIAALLLFWQAERQWARGQRTWLVRLTRPDLLLLWAAGAEVLVAFGLLSSINYTGRGAAFDQLWLLMLFPLLYLSERVTVRGFVLVLFLACNLLLLVRHLAGYGLADSLLAPLWLALLAGTNHYLVRRYFMYERRAELLREVANDLSNTLDVDAALPTLAAMIARRLRYSHLAIWMPRTPPSPSGRGAEGEGELLELNASYGLSDVKLSAARLTEVWRTQKSQFPSPNGRGVRGEGELSIFKSSLAVPIRSEGQPVGVLEVLSPRADEFWEFDVEQLTLMADSIGLALARSRHAQREAQNLRDTLWETVRRLSDCETAEEMFTVLAAEAHQRLNVDVVLLYQLAPGTGYPLVPYIIGSTAQPAHPLPATTLAELLIRWEPHYAALATDAHYAQHRVPNDFIARENLHTLAFLPLGPRSERAGALFIGYRRAHSFSPLEKLTLEAFASLAAEHINRARATWGKYEAFGGVLFGVHGPLTLSADSLRRLIGSAQETLAAGETAPAAQALAAAQKVVRRLEIAAMLTRLSKRESDETSLQEDVRRAATKILHLTEPAGGRAIVNIPPEADDLPFAVQDAVYCLALEASANASFHGGAQKIEIELEVEPTELTLTVSDNGRGFEVNTARPGPNGIFEGLALVQKQFAARGQVHSTPGAGTQVVIIFPMLPEESEN